MEFVRYLLGTSPPQPINETDDVFPLHMLDDTQTLRQILVGWTLHFNDVLDADKLHASLSALLDTGDWRKLGGRLRLKNGKLELHVPQRYTESRPALTYSHKTSLVNLRDHPLGSKLPNPTDKAAVSIYDDPVSFRPFVARDHHPETFEDYLYHDTPILSLHITSFNDATLVALTWPHCIMDVLGQQALLKAWCLVLAGQESQLPPLLGARQDTMAALADDPSEPPEEFTLKNSLLQGFAFGNFVFHLMWDRFWNPPLETHILFVPKQFIDRLKTQAQNDLKSASKEGDKEAPIFVSEGDVITAWMSRFISSSLPAPRPITVLHAVNTRLRFPALKQAAGLYVQNMALGAFTFLSPETAQKRLGQVALENRTHLMEQATKGQMLAFLRHLRSSGAAADPAHVLCGPSDGLLLPFTNWERADFFNVIDFGPAVKAAGEKSEFRTNPPGKMVHHHALNLQRNQSNMNVVVVLGKEQQGNYWLSACLLPSTWVKIKESLTDTV
ncbi:hypothetical protein H072_7394 [Dactylellina haptotyla CBS 200.50]|uniref:Uncharacterized protein n=1 Tax=Dactylellina haptotyla (strain CBS 200.50) TaxID=1284197 RepID=S8BU94_DACHA|nr:hypothetical protein H072_7394 [Dactylellina haptotyla CBS 200.50]